MVAAPIEEEKEQPINLIQIEEEKLEGVGDNRREIEQRFNAEQVEQVQEAVQSSDEESNSSQSEDEYPLVASEGTVRESRLLPCISDGDVRIKNGLSRGIFGEQLQNITKVYVFV